MQKITILGPAKSGTTYLGSRLPSSRVLHDIGRSRFRILTQYRKAFFFINLIFTKNILILPRRDDTSRRQSVFWNDFELALIHFKRTSQRYKTLRYDNPENFLQACYQSYPFELYAEWFNRNSLNLITKLPKEGIHRVKFFRSELIICPLDQVEEFLSTIDNLTQLSSQNLRFNKKEEFWHSFLHQYVKGNNID